MQLHMMSFVSSCIFKQNRWHSSIFITFFCFSHVKAVTGMARPEMESRVDDRNPGAPNSCRMEVLRHLPSGSIVPPCHRYRTIATQTSTVTAPLPHVPTQDAFSSDSVQQQDSLLRDNTGKALQHSDHAAELMFMRCASVEIISIIYLNEIQKTKSMALTPRVKMQQMWLPAPPQSESSV